LQILQQLSSWISIGLVWKEKSKTRREIRFYPFIPKVNLKKYKLSAQARRENYWMFKYIGLNRLPYFVMSAE